MNINSMDSLCPYGRKEQSAFRDGDSMDARQTRYDAGIGLDFCERPFRPVPFPNPVLIEANPFSKPATPWLTPRQIKPSKKIW